MHGIARYTRGLVRALARDPGPFRLHVFARADAPPGLAPRTEGVDIRPYSLREQWAVPRRIRRAGAALYHSTTFTAPLACPVPSIVTIYDLTPIAHYGIRRPLHLAYYAIIVRAAARRAAFVITVSNPSARAIARRLGVPPRRIEVIPPGIDTESIERAIGTGSAPRREGFTVAAVGGRLPHKNLRAAIEGFEAFARSDPARRLVILGEIDPVARSALARSRARVETRGPLPDEAFYREIASADAFVFPSLAEGFGLPPLEAMACGVPVVASRAGALPETLGDAALLFDPRDPAALPALLDRLAGAPDLRRDLSARGRRRARGFSWAAAAAATRALYAQVLLRGLPRAL
ncbi:MAG: glycosyltransferase family 4 protein [Planctomycetes bacterium]|nr:glycosyltransferase family 4 protein [Planctomycetota bacterium]